MGDLYDKAESTVKATANAIIIDALKDTEFMRAVHDRTIAIGGKRDDAFQQVLDGLRDSVIEDAQLNSKFKKSPQSLLKQNGEDNRIDAGKQKELLISFKTKIENEGQPTRQDATVLNQDYTAQQLAEFFIHRDNANLPKLNIAYKADASLLDGHGLNAQASAASSKQR